MTRPHKAWLIILGPAAACALILAGVAMAGSSGRAVHTVVYEADGTETTEATYTLRAEDGGTVQGDINPPMRNQAGDLGLRFGGFSSGDFVYLSVQNRGDRGSITCRITVDGVVVSENTSVGGHVIASCQGEVP